MNQRLGYVRAVRSIKIRIVSYLRRIVQTLTRRGIRIEFVKEGPTFADKYSPIAQLMLSVIGAFAEFERALLRKWQREGIELAKQCNVYKGRKRALLPARQANSPSASPTGKAWRTWRGSLAAEARPYTDI